MDEALDLEKIGTTKKLRGENLHAKILSMAFVVLN
jgi:hypothetical protein